MSAPTRDLGRGLSPLVSSPNPPHRVARGTIPIAAIRAGVYQPRTSMTPELIEALAASIKSQGVIQPIVVRPVAGLPHQFEIVAGERRWRAAKLAGIAEIPAIIRDLSDREALAVALIENIQREELTPTDEARALKRLTEEFTLTHEEAAEAVGRSRAAVTNLLRLLDLPADVIDMVDTRALSMGHARALLGLEEESQCRALAAQIVERQWSVRETELKVRRAQVQPTPPEASATAASPVVDVLRTRGVRVRMQERPDGETRIVLDVKEPALRDALLAAIRAVAGEEG